MYNPTVSTTSAGLLLAIFIVHFARTYWKLRHIPGPFFAKFSNLPRFWWVKTKKSHAIHQGIHEKFGSVVRLGPNMVTVSDPAAIAKIYPMRPGFPKGDFYKAFMPYSRSVPSLPLPFNVQDEKLHKKLRNPIAPIFSLSNTLALERFIDQVTELFFEQLDKRFAGSYETFDLGDWLEFFAFDVMGTLTFSKRYGFLENGRDDRKLMEAIWNLMEADAPMTQIPWFDKLWNKNPVAAMFRPAVSLPILKVAQDGIDERKMMIDKDDGLDKTNQFDNGDMLSRFLSAQSADKSIPSWAVVGWTYSNVIAGSDTTATTLQTVFFQLLTHPETQERLHEELAAANLSKPYPAWSELRDLPYLDACVNEALRLHPPFCLPFERNVPSEGVTICGKYFPGGTVIGMNPYVVNRHQPTFGADANEWRPDRWLEKDEEHQRKLEQSLLTFGAGRRVCLGKNLAILELKKLTSALLLNYDIEIVDPAKHFVENSWFFRQKGLEVKLRRRSVVTGE